MRHQPGLDGTFDATTGFVGMTLADCGAVESPILNVGNGVQLQFLNVTGWNNTDGVGPEAVQALTGDHFFSDATGEFGGDNPVNFQVTGMNCCDTLTSSSSIVAVPRRPWYLRGRTTLV